MKQNIDHAVVRDFGDEWARHQQDDVPHAELEQYFAEYFSVFPWEALPTGARGFDLGCGSGRWAAFVAPRVGHLTCIDPAKAALDVAQRKLSSHSNVTFAQAAVDEIPLEDGSQDFGYALGVLHHIPDTAAAMRRCTAKLKPGAPFLVYLYYAFDNRPAWFRAVWRTSDVVRRVVARLPHTARSVVSTAIALSVYWPLSRVAGTLNKPSFPLWAYRDASIATQRTDARDRFGTRLEQRFTRAQIEAMMRDAGLERITFREGGPYWCAVGYQALSSMH